MSTTKSQSEPQFPLYIVSKGRWESRLTAKALLAMRVPFRVVVEEAELANYAAVLDPKLLLVLDPLYKERYEVCDEHGLTKSTGPGPARNFAWDHSVSEGHAWHWVMDDNISCFYRLHLNQKIRFGDGTPFRAMEDFVQRYKNVGMAGPNYATFAPRKKRHPPFVLNTRIYSCNLIRNDLPFRWRGRYNEDTDLSLRILKAKWVTVQFYAFLQAKMATQRLKGGNTAEFYHAEGKVEPGAVYAKGGTDAKSAMQVKLHPDVSRLTWRFGRVHHLVDYRPFKGVGLIPRDDAVIPAGPDNRGLKLVSKKMEA